MSAGKVHHFVIGDPTHPDCPLCKQAAAEPRAHAPAVRATKQNAVRTRERHPDRCSCRFCRPMGAAYIFTPLQPWEDEIVDVVVEQADGSLRVTASYRVERDASITWLTPDGRAPKSMRS